MSNAKTTPSPFLLVANFKSHKTRKDFDDWARAVTPVAQASPHLGIVVAPSYPHLPLLTSYPALIACSQDVSPYPPGSYTGAVSAPQLLDCKVRYCLIGHSERRHYFHETCAEIANKVQELVSHHLTPILCLGQADVIPQFAALDEALLPHLIFAYEPPEAIGGTTLPKSEDIIKGLDHLRRRHPLARVIYGGSVNADNILHLTSLGLVGALVGSASLSPADFIAIINKLG